MPALDSGSPALALDYQKCFDRLRPELVLKYLELRQWPHTLLLLLRHVWLQQSRWLEIGHLGAGQAARVFASMPQGDPLSPLGLIVVLTEAVTSVARAGISQSVFLDDRFLVANSVKELLRGWRLWQDWSKRL